MDDAMMKKLYEAEVNAAGKLSREQAEELGLVEPVPVAVDDALKKCVALVNESGVGTIDYHALREEWLRNRS